MQCAIRSWTRSLEAVTHEPANGAQLVVEVLPIGRYVAVEGKGLLINAKPPKRSISRGVSGGWLQAGIHYSESAIACQSIRGSDKWT